MTMVYCQSCERDVHITHTVDECEGNANITAPQELRGPPEPEDVDGDEQ